MRARAPSLETVFFSLACASPPPVSPVDVGPVAPGAGEKVIVDQSILIVDASSSVADAFPGEKAMVQSLVGRAESVRSYFTSQGIAAARLETRRFGETQPIAPNDTAENLRRNRRTELTPIGE